MALSNWPLVIVWVLYVTLGLAYGVGNPPFEGMDEEAHFRYIHWLAKHHSLPVAAPELYEAWQPPLYYVMGAGVSRWVDTSDLEEQIGISQRNPFWPYEIGEVGNDNKNQYFHQPLSIHSFQKTALALYLLRGLSLLIGAITVAATYLIVAEIFPHCPELRWGTAALVGLNPQFLYMNSNVTNDGLVVCLTALTMWWVLRQMRAGWTARASLGLGVLVAGAALSKLTGWIVAPLILLAAAIEVWQTRRVRRTLGCLLLVAGIALLLSGWWFGRNILLYGDWTGLAALRGITGNLPPMTSWDEIRITLSRVAVSYWALFGSDVVPAAPQVYQAIYFFVGWGLLGLALAAYRHPYRSLAKTTRLQLVVLGAWIGLAGLGVLYNLTGTPIGSHGRHLLIAAPALSLLLFLGLWYLCPPRLKRLSPAAVTLAMTGLATICLAFYLLPAYARPPVVSAHHLPAIAHPVEVYYGDRVVLRGYDLDRASVRPGEKLTVTLYWEVLRPFEHNYTVFVKLFGRGHQLVGQRDTHPGRGNFPTSQWQPETVVVDTVPVRVAPEAHAPACAQIEVGWHEQGRETLPNLSPTDCAGQPVDGIIGAVRLSPLQTPVYSPAQTVRFDLGGQIALTGYTVAITTTRPLTVALYWQAQQPLSTNYTVFLHLTDERDQIVWQVDEPPLQGDYPTSCWQPWETVHDVHTFPPARGLRGSFALWCGLYELQTGQRLPVYTASGAHLPDDRIPLGQFIFPGER